jgi:plasmid maintenance system antidote protein VapI
MKDQIIKKRIIEAIEDLGGNSSKMARLIGVTPNYLASVITNKKKGVSATLLKGFAKAGMNLNWLVMGKAGMWMNNKGNGNSLATLETVQAKLDDALDLISKLEYYVNRLEKLNHQQSEGRENETIIA